MARLQHLTARGRETQRALRDALMQLIVEKGFAQVTIKDITDRAAVERTTFYLHYADKRELFAQSQEQLIDELLGRDGGDPASGDPILWAFRHMAEHAAAYRALLTIGDPALDGRLHAYVAAQIAVGLRTRAGDGTLTGTPPRDLLAQYYASALRGTAKWWLEQGMPHPPEEMARVFRNLLLGGLAACGLGLVPEE